MNHLPIDPDADSRRRARAALPQLQPGPRLLTMPKQRLPNPLAIPPQECRHPRFTAMPNMRPLADG